MITLVTSQGSDPSNGTGTQGRRFLTEKEAWEMYEKARKKRLDKKQ